MARAHKRPFDAAFLRRHLVYDETTGDFVWLRRADTGKGARAFNTRFVGTVAGKRNPNGYIHISLGAERILAHRLAWLYVHGEWPAEEIDHIDGDPSNNRIANLRAATSFQNKGNQKVSRNNKAGYKGVWWHAQRGKWAAGISVGHRHKHLGLFDDPAEASAAYVKAAQAAYGEFATDGRARAA